MLISSQPVSCPGLDSGAWDLRDLRDDSKIRVMTEGIYYKDLYKVNHHYNMSILKIYNYIYNY